MTPQQLLDMRGDLDIPLGSVFTDTELNRYFDRANGSYDVTKVYVIKALMMSAAKLTDYKAGQSSESLSQVVTNLKIVLSDAESVAGLAGAITAVGNFGLNIDATEDNASEWDGST